MKRNTLLNIVLTCTFAFAGGAVSEQIFSSKMARAAADEIKEFFDTTGKKRLDLGVANGAPVQDFYGDDGLVRLQFGTYTAASDKGLPLAVFSDNDHHIRLLLRLAGINQSPALVFKDSKGADRIVMGLALSDNSEDPFFIYTDSTGTHNLLSSNTTDTKH